MAEAISVYKMACARIPTDVGDFTLCLYHNNLDDKEHLALIAGDAAELASGETQPPVLVRVHSECYTGDVLGSRRCDCGPQLAAAMQLIAEEGRGIILYLRQEGRGIGLLDKLRAYNLQDVGYDTVDANFLLGHQADVRDYRVAAEMLKDLGVYSMRLMTNNPDKIAGLERRGLRVTERVPLQTAVHAENAHYLDTKVRRMRHLMHLDFPSSNGAAGAAADLRRDAMLRELTTFPAGRDGRPFVTLTYAQSLDGSIAARRGEQTLISGPQAARLTHQLRAAHDAILVGIGTVLSDDPRLTVRHAPGRDPQPVIVDSQLRFPLGAKLISDGRRPWIVTTEAADAERQAALEAAGARIIRLPAGPDGQVDLRAMLEQLGRLSVRSLMVEGGAAIITSFLLAGLADRLVLTIAPRLIGGLNAVERRDAQNGRVLPPLLRPRYQPLGDDMILYGDLAGE